MSSFCSRMLLLEQMRHQPYPIFGKPQMLKKMTESPELRKNASLFYSIDATPEDIGLASVHVFESLFLSPMNRSNTQGK